MWMDTSLFFFKAQEIQIFKKKFSKKVEKKKKKPKLIKKNPIIPKKTKLEKEKEKEKEKRIAIKKTKHNYQ